MRYPNKSNEIDLVIFEKDNTITGEIYLNKSQTTYGAFDCEDLIGELLIMDIKEDNRKNGRFVKMKCDCESKINDIIYDLEKSLNFHYFLRDVLREEYIPNDDNTYFDIIDFLNICFKNDIVVNYENFEMFMIASNLEYKSYTNIYYEEGYKTSAGMIFERIISSKSFLELMNDKTKIKKAFLYEDCSYSDFIYIIIFHILKSGKILKKCKYCQKWFVPKKSDEKYCNKRIVDIMTKSGQLTFDIEPNCKTKANKEVRKNRDDKNPIVKIENRVRTKLLNKTKTKNITVEERKKRQKKYNDFLDEKYQKKNQLKNKLITEKDYIDWLESR